MATKDKSTSGKKRHAANTGYNRSDSGPATPPAPGNSPTKGVQRAAAVGSTAGKMPYNPTKPAEHGHENALNPPQGATVPTARNATASTLSEENENEKYGQPATRGINAAGGSLNRVRADSEGQPLTTNQGVRVSDNQNSLKAGLRGPALLKDFILREKLTHFDHERIPERVVHARGSGAHGYFECYEPLTHLTCAAPFATVGKITPVFVRFSTVAGERGSKDTARDVRGFAVKFYTDEGNWDLVGNNMPVFFIQDAMKFPDLVHAVKPEQHHAMPQAASAHDTYWDFVSLMPESTHMLMWQMSDRAIPRSFRMMQGFGVHTFRFVNAEGHSTFVKFHWNPKLGTHSQVWDEAVKVSGADPDYHRRDLWEAINSGHYPEWELCVQLFSEEQAASFSFDVLDSTKIVPEELVPLTPVGRMVLNRNPDNFFAETEQVAFCAAHVVPGIDFTNDPLLAGRIHSYVDTQITRLGGPNFHELPINAPLAPIHNNQRDGMHRQAIARGAVAYEPNSLAGGCPFQAGKAGYVSFPEPVQQDELRGKPEKFAEHYNQAALFYNSQTPAEQEHIAGGFRFELSKVTVPAVRQRVVSMLRNASEDLAARVAEGLGMKLPDPMPLALENPPQPEVTVSPSLSLMARPGDGSIATRMVAVLVADGIDSASVWTLVDRLEAEGAIVRLVGQYIGPVTVSSGDGTLDADASLENHPGALFDAVAVPASAEAITRLASDPKAREFLQDQFLHAKAMLATRDAEPLLRKAGITPKAETAPGMLVTQQIDEDAVQHFISAISKHRHFAREKPPVQRMAVAE